MANQTTTLAKKTLHDFRDPLLTIGDNVYGLLEAVRFHKYNFVHTTDEFNTTKDLLAKVQELEQAIENLRAFATENYNWD